MKMDEYIEELLASQEEHDIKFIDLDEEQWGGDDAVEIQLTLLLK